ncbi:transcriptional regulator [Bordetella pertussis]|nr:transcriptional regulator [Bordetella pertussis]
MSQAANPTALPAWDPPAILAQLRANTCFGHMAEPTLAAFAAIAQCAGWTMANCWPDAARPPPAW